MAEVKAWKPLGETLSSQLEAELARAIRLVLPPLSTLGTPEWERGEQRWDNQPSTSSGAAQVQLIRLTWRLLERLEFNDRTMSQSRFEGVAICAGKMVDFSGESLRDEFTGGFWNFTLHTVGLPGAKS